MTTTHMDISSLPQPESTAKTHSATVLDLIRKEIATAGGSIGFDRYMELALYTPALGYYSAGLHKFGRGGDFVTAPELSPLFSRCLARQCAQLLEHISNGEVLEFGAGTGVMAADILTELQHLDCLPERYCILELSAELRARQRETLEARAPQLLSRIEWLDGLPQHFKGIVLGNEILDAMPAQCFAVRGSTVVERQVGVDENNQPGWQERPADELLLAHVANISKDLPAALEDGYCSEFNARLDPWMQSLAECLDQAVVLLIDYGYPRREYYHPERRDGTLICHYQHRAHNDPFFYPGLQDISANVDFTAVAEAAEASGLSLAGYTSQANFLIANGLEEFYAEAVDEQARLRMSQQIKLLTLPSEMGERFQVMALSKGVTESLQGFSLRDYCSRL